MLSNLTLQPLRDMRGRPLDDVDGLGRHAHGLGGLVGALLDAVGHDTRSPTWAASD